MNCFQRRADITLRGQEFYLEENEPERQMLVWLSSRDGELGRGLVVDLATLSPGDGDKADETLHDLESTQACQRLLPEVVLAGMKREVTTTPLQFLPHSHTQVPHRP